METFLELLPMLTPVEYEVSVEVILNPLKVTPSIPEAIATSPDTTASLTLVAAVPGAIELFGPRIVSALSILKFPVYVPALTVIVSPALAAFIAVCTFLNGASVVPAAASFPEEDTYQVVGHVSIVHHGFETTCEETSE
jgi:hypothetical protein